MENSGRLNLLIMGLVVGGLLVAGLLSGGGGGSTPSIIPPTVTPTPSSGALTPGAIADVHPPDAPFAVDETVVADCAPDDTICLVQAYANLAFRSGPKVALEQIAAETRPEVVFACHQISHRIGAAALAANGDRAGAAFVAGDATCASGYYHGVLQHAFLDVDLGDLAAIGRRAGKICVDPEIQATGYLAFQCGHGLGHGLLIATGYDLPMALEACAALPNEYETEWCTSGVHMENFTPSYGRQTAWVSADDLRYPCNVLQPEQGKASCYNIVAIRAIEGSGQRWEAVAAACGAAEAEYQEICFEGMGLQIQGRISSPQEGLELCAIAAAFAPTCVEGIAASFVNDYVNGIEALRVCAAVSEGAQAAACAVRVGSALRATTATSAQAVEACRAAIRPESRAIEADCIRGASR
jgi:hypothetical protein